MEKQKVRGYFLIKKKRLFINRFLNQVKNGWRGLINWESFYYYWIGGNEWKIKILWKIWD